LSSQNRLGTARSRTTVYNVIAAVAMGFSIIGWRFYANVTRNNILLCL